MFYVYHDVNLDTGLAFYYGSGTMSRVKDPRPRNRKWVNYTNKYKNWKRFIIYQTESREDAYDVEELYIALSWDLNCLTNLVIDSRNHKELAVLGGKRAKELKAGFHSFTPEQRSQQIKDWYANMTEEEYAHHTARNLENFGDINSVFVTCEHCSKEVNFSNYKRWHGDNCLSIKSRETSNCEFCNQEFESSNIGQHSRSCKSNPDRQIIKRDKTPCKYCNNLYAIICMSRHEKSCPDNPDKTISKSAMYRCAKCNKSVRYTAQEEHNKKCLK